MTDQIETNPSKAIIENLRRQYFAPGQLAEANTALQIVVNACAELKLPVRYNFDPNGEFPDGYGIAVIPIPQQVKGVGNVTVGISVAAIPDPDAIANAEGGIEFLRKTVISACLAKVSNAVRPRADGSVASSVPFSIADFITSMRGGEGTLAVYQELAKDMVKALRAKGLKHITIPILREVLQSAAFAAEQYPRIDQAKWVLVLDAMIVRAKAKAMDASVLESWKSTRDSAELSPDELNIEGLDDLAA